MRMVRFLIILCVTALVVGCGSGGHDTPPPSASTDSVEIPTPEPEPVVSKPEPVRYPTGPVPAISIHQAAANGDIDTVRQHIAVQAPDYINTSNEGGWTPLHFSYANGQHEMSRFLMDHGANYEAHNKLGQAPADIVLLKNNFKSSPFALVELFTSESCSSCPPAERLTSEIRRMALAKRLKIFCVSFHVDYFDGGSWTDGFSDAGYSARQRAYEFKRFSGLYYTPQMIVNGEYQTLGHNRANAYRAINRALKKPAQVAVSVRQVNKHDGTLAVNACALGKMENAAICVALVENGIRRRITGGENKGRTLSMDNIVLDFQYHEIPGSAGCEFQFKEKPDPNRNLNVVAFVQSFDSMLILGANATPIRQLGQVAPAKL
jgi:hypothetical protein